MWKLLSVFLLLLLASRFDAQDTAQPEGEQARILTLENAWNQSVQQKDASALRMLLAPDLIYVDYDGTLMNKAEYLASIQSLAASSRAHCERIDEHTFLRYGCCGHGRVSRKWREERQALCTPGAFYGHMGPPGR